MTYLRRRSRELSARLRCRLDRRLLVDLPLEGEPLSEDGAAELRVGNGRELVLATQRLDLEAESSLVVVGCVGGRRGCTVLAPPAAVDDQADDEDEGEDGAHGDADDRLNRFKYETILHT